MEKDGKPMGKLPAHGFRAKSERGAPPLVLKKSAPAARVNLREKNLRKELDLCARNAILVHFLGFRE